MVLLDVSKVTRWLFFPDTVISLLATGTLSILSVTLQAPERSPVLVTLALMVTALPTSTVAGVMDRLLMVREAGRVEAKRPKILKWVTCAITAWFARSTLEVSVSHPLVVAFQTAITRFLSSTPAGT